MKCTCSIDAACDDFASEGFIQDKIVTARKTHRCSECSRVILPGEKYEHTSCVLDREWSRYKTCLDCQSLRVVFLEKGYCGGSWESFSEYLRECKGNVPEACISKLTPAAREKVCELIENIWEDEEWNTKKR